MTPSTYKKFLSASLKSLILWLTLTPLAQSKASQETIKFLNFGEPVTLKKVGNYYHNADNKIAFKVSNNIIILHNQPITLKSLKTTSKKITQKNTLYRHNNLEISLLETHNITQVNELQGLINALQNQKNIVAVQPDILQIRTKKITDNSQDNSHPAESLSPNQYLNYLDKIGIQQLWRFTLGQGVRVAVIDDGFELQHSALSHITPLFQYDTEQKSLTATPLSRLDTHGTKIAGVIFANHNIENHSIENHSIENNNIKNNSASNPYNEQSNNEFSKHFRIKGIAPKADFIAIRQPNTWTSQTVTSFQIANLYNVDIINCSWNSPLLLEPIAVAINSLSTYGRSGKGTAIIIAAGNQGHIIKPFSIEASLALPIVVGAHNTQGQKMISSNFGKSVDVFALGSTVLTSGQNNQYKALSGTSLAAAITTGASALLLAQDPTQTIDTLTINLKHLLLTNDSKEFDRVNYARN